MKPLRTTTIISSAIVLGLAISGSLAEPAARRNHEIKYSPMLAKMHCEQRGWLYREVCTRFAPEKNCKPSLHFGCQNECVETSLQCIPRGRK